MRKRILIVTTLILFQLLLPIFFATKALSQTKDPAVKTSAQSGAQISTPEEGELFPDLSLPLPQRVDERKYLGVEQGPFKISQIGTEALIVEVFNMYCPHCQKEAPNVNNLFEAISKRPDLKSRLKLIGIGAGNSVFEVNSYRNLYRIEYPLIPDGNMSIYKQLGEVGTPYFFVIRYNPPPGRPQVIYSKVGTLGEPAVFLEMIAEKLDGKKSK